QRMFEMIPRKPPNATVVKASTGGAFFKGSLRVSPSLSRSRFNARWTCEEQTSSTSASRQSKPFLARKFISLSPEQWPARAVLRSPCRRSRQFLQATEQSGQRQSQAVPRKHC